MILEDDIFSVGVTRKPYGIKGELNVQFNKAEYANLDSEYYFLRIDGIPVPFFVEEITFITDEIVRIKFEDLNDEKIASKYSNLEMLVDRKLLENIQTDSHSSDWHLFIDYSLVDQKGEIVGVIADVDDSTINILFLVKQGNNELLIPATDDFILDVDDENKIIKMNLPEGLLDN